MIVVFILIGFFLDDARLTLLGKNWCWSCALGTEKVNWGNDSSVLEWVRGWWDEACRSLELEPLLAFGSIFITFWIKIFYKLKFLPDFPERLLTTTICPFRRSIIWGRIAFVREIVPTVFKSKIARSTSSEVFLIKPSCPLAPLLTKISTWKETEHCRIIWKASTHKNLIRTALSSLKHEYN